MKQVRLVKMDVLPGKMEDPAVGLGTSGRPPHEGTLDGQFTCMKKGYCILWDFVSRQSAREDILTIFIQEHLDQPLKSEKLPFPQTET